MSTLQGYQRSVSDLNKKAESYVDHILIAARCGDKSSGLWRNLFDNWNCYTRGHPFVTRGGKGQPRWFNNVNVNEKRQMLEAMHRRSRRADETMQRQAGEIVVVDHVVPVNVLRDMLIEQGNVLTPADVSAFLEEYYRLCVIMPDEHKRLNTGEFHKERLQPAGFWNRYASAGIELIEP